VPLCLDAPLCTFDSLEGMASMQRRNTRQRQLVFEAVQHLRNHPTADDIYLYVRSIDSKISRGTVYRNLNLLSDQGAILDVRVPGGDHFDFNTTEHAHLVCRECGAVVDALGPACTVSEDADAQVEAQTGYSEVGHALLFTGLCPACQQKLQESEEKSA
jgi:Fe2+ or Zn2+ uptake regulation protein